MAITQPLSIQTDEEYIDLYIDFTYSKKTYQEYGEPLGLKAADLWRKVLLGEDMFKKTEGVPDSEEGSIGDETNPDG